MQRRHSLLYDLYPSNYVKLKQASKKDLKPKFVTLILIRPVICRITFKSHLLLSFYQCKSHFVIVISVFHKKIVCSYFISMITLKGFNVGANWALCVIKFKVNVDSCISTLFLLARAHTVRSTLTHGELFQR